jgi:hypothetical protein
MIWKSLTTYLNGAGVSAEIPIGGFGLASTGASNPVNKKVKSKMKKTVFVTVLIINPSPLFHGIGHNRQIGFFIILFQPRFFGCPEIADMILTIVSAGNIIEDEARNVIVMKGIIANSPAFFKKEHPVNMLKILIPGSITQFFIGLGSIQPGKMVADKNHKAFRVLNSNIIDKFCKGLGPVIKLVDAALKMSILDSTLNSNQDGPLFWIHLMGKMPVHADHIIK